MPPRPKVDENELKESFIRGSGPGGQCVSRGEESGHVTTEQSRSKAGHVITEYVRSRDPELGGVAGSGDVNSMN